MSDTSRNQIPEDSIEETRRKKMEEFRRSADRNAIRGDYGDEAENAQPAEPPVNTADDYAQRRRKRNTEINSYSDDMTKKRI